MENEKKESNTEELKAMLCSGTIESDQEQLKQSPSREGQHNPVSETKRLRQNLDFQLQELKDSPRKSRERSIAITKIQEAIMWLGMDLKDLGTPNPYPQSYNPNSPDIEPAADNLKL